MAKTNNLDDFLKDLADGIRAKKGTTDTIKVQDFRTEIESIPSGGKPEEVRAVIYVKNGVETITATPGKTISSITITVDVQTPETTAPPTVYFIRSDGAVLGEITSNELCYITANGILDEGRNFIVECSGLLGLSFTEGTVPDFILCDNPINFNTIDESGEINLYLITDSDITAEEMFSELIKTRYAM